MNTLFLPQNKHIKNKVIETNNEPPHTNYTKFTTKCIESNNTPKKIIIKTTSNPVKVE